MRHITHQFSESAFYVPEWDIKHLFIGTFNPSGGEEVNYHYGRSRNQAWPTLSLIFNCNLSPASKEEFFPLLRKHGIACMDLIDEVQCPIDKIDNVLGKGYSDSQIICGAVHRNYNTSNIIKVIERNPGINVYSTWGEGPKLKEWRNETSKLGDIVKLVSPSLAARVPKGTSKIPYILNDWKEKIINE